MVRRYRWLLPLLPLALSGCGPNGLGGLSSAQREAVETVTRLVRSFAQVEATFAGVADIQNLVGAVVGGTFGNCPRITARQRATRVTLNLDYGAGCNAPGVGGRLVSGALGFGVDVAGLTGSVEFDRLAIVGQPITGRLEVRPTSLRLNDMEVEAQRLTIGELGTVDGVSRLRLDRGALSLSDGNLTLSNLAGTRYVVTLTGLAINPTRWGNAVPEAGRLSFPLPVRVLGLDSVDAEIDFSDRSPRDGTVQVRLGPVGPISYRLQHITD